MADIAQTIFSNALSSQKNFCIFITISFSFAQKGPVHKKSALVKVMDWRLTDDQPLPEPTLTQMLDATCVIINHNKSNV